MKSDGEEDLDGASPRHCYGNVSKQQPTNDPSQCSGNADPSDQKEQYPKSRLERCSNKIHDSEQHQDSSQFFRSAYGFQRRNTDDDPNDFMR